MTGKDISETLVLVVDDNAMSRAVIEHRLVGDGFTVLSATSGAEAISVVNNETVDLILLDLVMGGMSGMEVLTTLKADDRYKHIPVVVISGVEDGAPIANVKAAGAIDFLPKPVTAPILRQTIDNVLGTSLAGSSSDGNADGAVGSGKGSGQSVDQLPVFNQDHITQLISDYGKETASGFIVQFESLASDQRDAIAAARDSNNIEAWNRAAHDLKGGAKTMGLIRLAAICRDIEMACKEDRMDDAHRSSETMEQHIDEALEALRTYTATL